MFFHRFPPIGALLLLAALASALGPGAWASHDPAYTHDPAPVVYGDQEGEENNPTCAWLGQQSGQTWNELKVDTAPSDGSYDDQASSQNPGGPGGLVLTISSSDGKVFDWSSNMGVDAFVVKGGNQGSNVYTYGSEATGDERLHSPPNTKGEIPQISHISACYDEEEGGQQQGGDDDGQQDGDGDGGQEEGGGGQEEGGGDGGQQQGDQNNRAQDDGGQQDQGDQQETGDQQDQGSQQDGGGQQQQQQGSQQDDGDRQERTIQQDDDSDDGNRGERTPQDDSDNRSGESEGGVLGESESDDGIEEEDDAEDEDESDEDDEDEERDELPFTGAPIALLGLIGLLLVLTGLVGRRVEQP